MMLSLQYSTALPRTVLYFHAHKEGGRERAADMQKTHASKHTALTAQVATLCGKLYSTRGKGQGESAAGAPTSELRS